MNKVCFRILDAAMKRARNVAAPANAQRFEADDTCKRKPQEKCFDCKPPGTNLLSVSDYKIAQA
ncbi:MAG: hypothetical protein ACLS61_15610 [Ruminococcus sp.]